MNLLKTSLLAIVSVFLLGVVIASEFPVLDQITGYENLSQLNANPKTIDFNYCEYNNVGELGLKLNLIKVVGLGNETEWFPGDNIGLQLELENTGTLDLKEITLEYCIYDPIEKICVMKGKSADKFNLNSGLKTLKVMGIYVSLTIFSTEKDYILYIKANGELIQAVSFQEVNAYSLESEVTQEPVIQEITKTCISTFTPVKIVLPEPVYIEWDVDGDGLVGMSDLDFLVNYLFINGTPAPEPLLRADFNKNGYISLGDVMYLIDHLIKIGVLSPEENLPVIELISPENDHIFRTSDDEKNIRFQFKVSDESNIQSCSLILDNRVYQTIDNIEKDIVIEVTVLLDKDDYSWKVSCMDIYGNTGFSESRDFQIKEKKSTANKDPATPTIPKQPSTNNPQDTIFNQDDTISLSNDGVQKQSSINWTALAIIVAAAIVIVLIIIISLIIIARK